MHIRSGDQAFLYLLFTFQCLIALYLFVRLACEVCRCAKRSTKKSFFTRLAIAALLTYWAYHTSDIIQQDQSFASDWDPYRVLKLEDDGQFNSKEVREAYKRLSKKWHPDKVNWDKLRG
jgi:preprotein translocase subunit Sec63